MLIKTLAGIVLFAAAGAAVGYSKILCAGGECAITGSAYGGALFGGVLGLAVMSSVGTSQAYKPAEPNSPAEPTDSEDAPDRK